jgi:hypothetical protein
MAAQLPSERIAEGVAERSVKWSSIVAAIGVSAVAAVDDADAETADKRADAAAIEWSIVAAERATER